MTTAADEVDPALRNVIAPTRKPLENSGAIIAGQDADGADRIELEIEDLIRRLVKISTVASGGGVDAFKSSGDSILLDVEIDNVRCLVVRRSVPSALDLLSPREQEIARMVQLGYPNKTIATVLEISSWTVSSHLRRIFVKLGVSSRAAMATRVAGWPLGSADVDGRRDPEYRPVSGRRQSRYDSPYCNEDGISLEGHGRFSI